MSENAAIQIQPPFLFDKENNKNNRCYKQVGQHAFGFSYGLPYIVDWELPAICKNDEENEWQHLVLIVETTCSGVQFDRIGAIWIGGLEILRTSTQEPGGRDIYYKFEVDLTRYINFLKLKPKKKLVMALDNLVDKTYTGIFNITLTAVVYYSNKETKKDSFFNLNNENNIPQILKPSGEESVSIKDIPDLIFPLSNSDDNYGYFALRNNSKVTVSLPHLPKNKNFKKVLLEVQTSHHQSDEFYYLNTTNPYKEMQIFVNEKMAGIIHPFPLIFTGGITPYLWRPIVSIGALICPTYLIDVTPFLGDLIVNNGFNNVSFRVENGLDVW
ncbi:hypothetical protein HK099_007979 [Clydaea vesicula]|uniref:Peptide N-acetyl-beta-D-glucosaminyl asparaginase amidase A N-terminal domain-containing protein n=1 Tax=Clydaea vesicula TaxID=447962 RepID=A0AAD5U8S5_9FUNG|nr:hypothetical protein HK099_007979 [Clydaea vesicula]